MDPARILRDAADTAADTVDQLRRQAAEIQKVTQSVRPFIDAAQSGSFGISANAGQALIDAIHQCQDGLEDVRKKVVQIQEATKLGTSPDAVIVSRFNRDVAGGDSNSATQALLDLKLLLGQMENGVTEAMRHYRSMDEDGAGAVRRSGA